MWAVKAIEVLLSLLPTPVPKSSASEVLGNHQDNHQHPVPFVILEQIRTPCFNLTVVPTPFSSLLAAERLGMQMD